MDEVCEVVITAPDEGWLLAFTRQLVDEGLCASGHHIPIRSVYRWRGDIYDRPETRVALHTRRSLVHRIVERTEREHPYEVSCVVATTVVDGNPAYLQWVLAET